MAEFWRSTDFPHLEARRSCQENSCYRPHSHDTLSLGLIEAGTSVFTGARRATVLLQPGDVIVIPAGRVHACNPDGGRWRYQMIHMDERWAAGLAPEHAVSHRRDGAAEATRGIAELLSGIGVYRESSVPETVRAWSELIFADAAAARVEAALRGLLTELGAATPLRRFDSAPGPGSTAAQHERPRVHDSAAPDSALVARLRPVLHRLRHDETNPPLRELAELAGMSRFALVRAVGHTTGLSPLAWRQNARIVEARRLLREGLPIADTANALGFADQSHFHRVFRAHVAASPGAYRAKRKNVQDAQSH